MIRVPAGLRSPAQGLRAQCLQALRVLLRLAMGSLFLYAAGDKLLHPDQFAEMLVDYRLLPLETVNWVAVWLPMLEAVLGVVVLLGAWVRPAALLMSGLLALFLLGIVSTLLRGLAVDCGCFSTQATGEGRTWLSLWQEGLMLLVCLGGWVAHWPAPSRPPAEA